MKKILTFIIILTFTLLPAISEPVIKDYDEFDIPTGSFIPVINLQEFSTAYNDETDTLKFVSTNDIYMYEHKILPSGTKFSGYIEKKNEPIIGTHASMKIFINSMELPDGFKLPIKGYLYTANNNIFGGGLTEPETYIKVRHYHRGIVRHFMGVIQFRPGPTRKMGEHITIASGADLLIVLVAPIHMTHLPLDN